MLDAPTPYVSFDEADFRRRIVYLQKHTLSSRPGRTAYNALLREIQSFLPRVTPPDAAALASPLPVQTVFVEFQVIADTHHEACNRVRPYVDGLRLTGVRVSEYDPYRLKSSRPTEVEFRLKDTPPRTQLTFAEAQYLCLYHTSMVRSAKAAGHTEDEQYHSARGAELSIIEPEHTSEDCPPPWHPLRRAGDNCPNCISHKVVRSRDVQD